MARTAVTPIAATASAHNVLNAGNATAIDVANGMQIDCSGIKSGKLLLIVQNTFAGSKAVTVRAGGINPPAFRKDLGDLTLTLAAQNDYSVVVLESSRFVGQSGAATMLYLDFAASMTGSVWAYKLPDTV